MIPLKTLKEISLRHIGQRDTLMRVGRAIWLKVENQPDYATLSDGERHFVYLDIIEGAVTESGFFGLLDEVAGQYIHQALAAYEAIGADRSATLVERAIKAMPTLPVPASQTERRAMLRELDEEAVKLLALLSKDFVESEEGIPRLLAEYIVAHSGQFDWASDDDLKL